MLTYSQKDDTQSQPARLVTLPGEEADEDDRNNNCDVKDAEYYSSLRAVQLISDLYASDYHRHKAYIHYTQEQKIDRYNYNAYFYAYL